MCKAALGILSAGLLMFSGSVWAQTGNPCDLNGDGAVNSADVQLAVNSAIGLSNCTANIAGAGVCNAAVVQRVVNASLGGACRTGTGSGAHSVTLYWGPSPSTGVSGYNVYRASTSGGPYTKLTSNPVTATSFVDNSVQSGASYFYVATSLSGSAESTYSNEAKATVPNP